MRPVRSVGSEVTEPFTMTPILPPPAFTANYAHIPELVRIDTPMPASAAEADATDSESFLRFAQSRGRVAEILGVKQFGDFSSGALSWR